MTTYPPTLYVKWMPGKTADDGFWFTADFQTPDSIAYTSTTPLAGRAERDEMNPYEIIAATERRLDNTLDTLVDVRKQNAAQAAELTAAQARIKELEAYIRIITSIPAVCDIEKSIAADGYENPITDARNLVQS